MKKRNLIFILISITIIIQFSYCVINREAISFDRFGQVEFNRLKMSRSNSFEKTYSKKALYLGAINIIEKYLTIYMILFVFSFYIRNRSILN